MTTTTVLVLGAGFLSGYLLRDFTWFARSGATRRALGITVHGLRHRYAADRYETLSGTPAPVRGGRLADREADLRARLGVAEELGHGRAQIAGAYLGARRKSAVVEG
jgi:hypothetical protein